MEDELIAKKDLLEITGISYGQLYRWKRKKLIPETWFIRKATFTGQETFFPKAKILKRVQSISELKDTLSLDELAERFSPQSVTKIVLSEVELLDRNIVSEMTLAIFKEFGSARHSFDFHDLLAMFLLDHLLKAGQMNRAEANDLLNVLKESSHKIYDKNSCLYFIRKMGVSIVFIAADDVTLYFDGGVKVIDRQLISASVEVLKACIEQSDQDENSKGDAQS
ncbi:YhbD family protein [Sporolactobacillus shoreicorticis]|uniref:YhbD family protein n=1 Tax=Sporolactobacillus shoreicorticis TaxID=1923877 RepID=A0ABW5S5N5_9BACL|nr:YhbD family protein [Sporolactobacillus shoreicorticis]MCO7127152.1 YhbD family protein [Sporolactobacillus shoreicorticis]